MEWYIGVLQKYAVFDGRARRKEYWFFVLFSTLVTIGLTVIDSTIGLLSTKFGVGALSSVYALQAGLQYCVFLKS